MAAELETARNGTSAVFLPLRDVRFNTPLAMVAWSGDVAQSNCMEISQHLSLILELPENEFVLVGEADVTLSVQSDCWIFP